MSQEQLVNILSLNDALSSKELSDLLKVNQRSVQFNIKVLIKRGLIEAIIKPKSILSERSIKYRLKKIINN